MVNSAVRQGGFTGGGVDRTVTAITNANPGVVTVPLVSQALTSITWSGGTATATTVNNHNYPIGSTIRLVVAGVTPAGYNGDVSATITGLKTFTYSISDPGGSASVLGTVAVGHGFNTGDKIIHKVTGGMANLHMLPCTITVVDADHYSLGVDTTSFGSFTGPTKTGSVDGGTGIQGMPNVTGITVGMSVTGPGIQADTIVTGFQSATAVYLNKNTTANSGSYVFSVGGTGNQYISLKVGTGNDRDPANGYPIMFNNGVDYASHYGNDYILAGDYKAFYFDKTIAALTDGSGNLVYGVWLFGANGPDIGHRGGIPLEAVAAIVNELNEMNPVHPIDLWVDNPHRGLQSSEPDYSAGSNFAVNATDVLMNGANGYAGLASPAVLWIEDSNETWNVGSAFTQSTYLARRGQCRAGAAWAATTISDYSSMAGLHAYLMAKDVRAAFPGHSRIKYVLAGQGTLGIGSSTMNYARIHGTTAMLTDSLNPNGDIPMSVFDMFAVAAYLFNNDSNATYSRDTCTTAWLAAGSDQVAKEAAFALYLAGVKTYGGNETIDRYYDTLFPAYAEHMVNMGKLFGMYEGGWDRTTGPGQPGWSGTTDHRNFLLAFKASVTWGYALRNAHAKFDSMTGAVMPADYVQTGVLGVGDRWGHGLNALDGNNLDPAWFMLGLRNRGLGRLRVRN